MKFLILILLFNMSIFGMEKSNLDFQDRYLFRKATEQDLSDLLNIIDTQAINDKNKIVILPKKFRAEILKKSIDSERIFVIIDNQTKKIVGCKKLFLITDEKEKQDILQNEIRCIGSQVNKKYSGIIKNNSKESILDFSNNTQNNKNLDLQDYAVCIYNGGDFTLPQNRGAGINSKLTDESLMSLKNLVLEYLENKKSKNISMVYGITDENSGNFPGDRADRTVSISKSFVKFIKSLGNLDNLNSEEVILNYKRYQAYMPTFKLDSEELIPLSDENSIPGNGCVLTYNFER